MSFKIATFNANSIRSRLKPVLDWLDKNGPDALAIQETKCQDKDFPAEAFAEAGWNVEFAGQKSYNGVATVSRKKARNVIKGLKGTSADEARLLTCKIGSVTVINAYAPQGRDPETKHFTYKLDWFEKLGDFIRENFKPSDKLILTGDLNVAPTEIDVHDPKRLLGHVCFRPEVWDALKKVTDWGFEDVFRKHVPEAGVYTFFDYRVKNAVKNKIGWRIDHILATKPLAQKSKTSHVDIEPRLGEKPSDHTFLTAEFDV